jgi:putative hydrolase of the HAD superfamily
VSHHAEVRGVTVDLDDTLFPQSEWLAGAWAAVADRATALGLDGPALHDALLRTCAEGSDRGRIIDRALEDVGVAPADCVGELVGAFAAHRPVRLRLFPEVADALLALGSRVPVVCVTDGDPGIQHGKIDALGLRPLLAGVVVSDQLGGRALRKPNPAPFRRALELVGQPAAHVVHVGDRPGKDVAGAAGVGMRCVRVLTGEYAGTADDAACPPWRTVASFTEAARGLLAEIGEQTGARARL